MVVMVRLPRTIVYMVHHGKFQLSAIDDVAEAN